MSINILDNPCQRNWCASTRSGHKRDFGFHIPISINDNENNDGDDDDVYDDDDDDDDDDKKKKRMIMIMIIMIRRRRRRNNQYRFPCIWVWESWPSFNFEF